MNTTHDTDEMFGAKALNWIVIAGAAILLLASVAAPAPAPKQETTAQASTPTETVIVTAPHLHHA